jgi:hypothetical protein
MPENIKASDPSQPPAVARPAVEDPLPATILHEVLGVQDGDSPTMSKAEADAGHAALLQVTRMINADRLAEAQEPVFTIDDLRKAINDIVERYRGG